ncbi:hypothetical protein [Isoptericola sp. G70]|uniref:hypothetical protein n=1 Tax=Isoptericola sp. G70 TaxID=3376633 RepID=UPI003A805AEE
MIVLPRSGAELECAWGLLFDLQTAMPDDWTIVGGQMVLLHCAERGAFPTRATDDLDAVLDVRANGQVLRDFTARLYERGFRPTGTSPQGHQHRWQAGGATVDVLIPRHVGARAASRTGITNATTLETPAAQQALDHSEAVEVRAGDHEGVVNRPSMLGALVAKAAASTVALDLGRDRHLIDFATLAVIARATDGVRNATKRDLHYLGHALGALRGRPDIVASIPGADDGVERVRRAFHLARERVTGSKGSTASQNRPGWVPPDAASRG